MTQDETARLIAYIAVFFPKVWDGIRGGEDAVIRAWHDLLQDVPAGAALAAVRAHLEISKFPPTVAEIRRAVLIPPTVQTPSESWREVQNAIRRFGSYRESEAMGSLSPLTREAVRLFGWRELCMSQDGDGVARAQFLRFAESVRLREERLALVSPQIRESLARLGNPLTDIRVLPAAEADA